MADSSAPRFTVVGIGEALFDIFPDHRQLGGAPLNLATCAHQLLAPHHGCGVVVSRVGQDALGDEVAAALASRGLSTAYLQTDPDRPTGTVVVDLDDAGQPSYEITPEVAWDVIQFDPDVQDLARACDAVAFGSLAQRDGQSRQTIYRFLDAARRAVKLFDVNLRQDDYDRAIIDRSCALATIVKLNEEELPKVAQLLGINDDEPAQVICKRYDLEMVALTRGKGGTRLYTKDDIIDGKPVTSNTSEGDAVGAGDACAAGIVVGRVLRKRAQAIADLANRCGAYVASQKGGTPVLADELVSST